MDPNNIGLMVEDALDESNFSMVSSNGMDDSKEMAEQKSEDMAMKKMNGLDNSDQISSMMQIVFQMGEKIHKMENKMDGVNKLNGELKEAVDEIKKKLNKMANDEFKEKDTKLSEENAKLKEVMAQRVQEMEEMKKAFAEFKAKKDEKNVQSNESEEKMDQKLVQIWVNDNGGNKWNVWNAGEKLAFRENARLILYFDTSEKYNTIRAQMPIPKMDFNRKRPCITGYYEVEIVKRERQAIGGLRIGFCWDLVHLSDITLKEIIGNQINSIGIRYDGIVNVNGSEMAITKNELPAACEFFNQGNAIGCGLHYNPKDPSLKFFVTLNGEMFGSIDLPFRYGNINLFPAVSFWNPGESIKANFGQDTWRFNPSQILN